MQNDRVQCRALRRSRRAAAADICLAPPPPIFKIGAPPPPPPTFGRRAADVQVINIFLLLFLNHSLVLTTSIRWYNDRQRSYMTVTLHFCSSDFHMQSMVLRTVVFTETRHTEVNIAKELKEIS